MANNYEPGTITPYFPTELVDKYEDTLGEHGVFFDKMGHLTYLYLEDGCSDWDELAHILQKMLTEWQDSGNLQDNGREAPQYCYYKACFYCDKMRQDEFGGFCCFITRDGLFFHSVDQFIMECQKEKVK